MRIDYQNSIKTSLTILLYYHSDANNFLKNSQTSYNLTNFFLTFLTWILSKNNNNVLILKQFFPKDYVKGKLPQKIYEAKNENHYCIPLQKMKKLRCFVKSLPVSLWSIYIFAGIKMLYEAWKMKPNEGEETQREVEEELARRGSTPSLNSTGKWRILKMNAEEKVIHKYNNGLEDISYFIIKRKYLKNPLQNISSVWRIRNLWCHNNFVHLYFFSSINTLSLNTKSLRKFVPTWGQWQIVT